MLSEDNRDVAQDRANGGQGHDMVSSITSEDADIVPSSPSQKCCASNGGHGEVNTSGAEGLDQVKSQDASYRTDQHPKPKFRGRNTVSPSFLPSPAFSVGVHYYLHWVVLFF
jgi:hypothetical protein